MSREIYEVKRERFHLTDRNLYLLEGTWPKGYEAEAVLDGKKISVEAKPQEYVSAMDRFQDMQLTSGMRIQIQVTLPSHLEQYKKLIIYAVDGQSRQKWFSVSVVQLQRKQGKPQYYLEETAVDRKAGTCRLRGWAVYKKPLSIYLEDENKKRLAVQVQRTKRPDVQAQHREARLQEDTGFYVEFPCGNNPYIYLVFDGKNAKTIRKIHLKSSKLMEEKLIRYYHKGTRYLKMHGAGALLQKVVRKATNQEPGPIPYEKWLPKHVPTPGQLENQRRSQFPYSPLISVVVPLYKTPERYLKQMIGSLQNQTYENWELCLSDGSGGESPIKTLLESYQREDHRIKVCFHDKPMQISENTNAAIGLAEGELIAFADHDDVLTPDALFECVKALNEQQEISVLYSDEDKMTMDGNKFFQPHFKPDFNIDLLCTVNYICHLFVVRREIIEQVGMLRKEYDGAQDYDFIFRCVEYAGRKHIYHIPRVLYHWRCHEDSTAENPESKKYAFEAGKKAILAHYDRIGVKASVENGEYLGLYRTHYIRDYDPLISIIIPNKDHTDDLERCIRAIEEKSSYRNYEYVIVENNSTEKTTFAYYRKLEQENPKAHVVYWEGKFNYSAINNFGISHAKGEYLLLLNNDTEIINADCLEELLGYCMRSDVGAVGARLYYEDETIQHAGVVIGFGGIAGHCFVQQKRGESGYCHRIICAQDYSAVTAACMMVKRKAYDMAGGLSEELEVAFNDIDFCLKLQKAGFLVVYNPYAELYHYESKSRGLDDTPEKVARFAREIETFEKRWPEILKDGDPYYNPNLTLDSQDFSLRRNG